VVGVAIMVLSIPLQTMVANYLKKLQEKREFDLSLDR
jgi:hypothetical protein